MRQPVSNFHTVVTASLAVSLTISLYCASAFWAYGQETLDAPQGNGAGDAPLSQDLPEDFQDLFPDPPSDQLPDPGGIELDVTGVPADPPGTPESTDREMDELFAELAEPDGDAWRRAQSDIERSWSRSGSAAMDLLYKRGEAALDAGDFTSAIGHLTALTDHAPDFASGWHLRAVALYLDGEFGPAVGDLARVLELEPRHFPALTQLGVMLEEVGDDEKALAAYRESLRINPHQEDAEDAMRRLEAKTAGTDA